MLFPPPDYQFTNHAERHCYLINIIIFFLQNIYSRVQRQTQDSPIIVSGVLENPIWVHLLTYKMDKLSSGTYWHRFALPFGDQYIIVWINYCSATPARVSSCGVVAYFWKLVRFYVLILCFQSYAFIFFRVYIEFTFFFTLRKKKRRSLKNTFCVNDLFHLKDVK